MPKKEQVVKVARRVPRKVWLILAAAVLAGLVGVATGVIGPHNPRAAFLDAVSGRVAAFLVDFSTWRMDALVRRG